MFSNDIDTDLDLDLDDNTDYQEFLLMVTTPETIKRDQYITDYHDAMSC